MDWLYISRNGLSLMVEDSQYAYEENSYQTNLLAHEKLQEGYRQYQDN